MLADWRQAPIALSTAAANEQHYEVPARFFELVLGPRLKYSCGLWPDRGGSLAAAEAAMLETYAERAQLADGQSVLDLGCGWGSFALWAAERWRQSQVLAVSNSRPQAEFIRARAASQGLSNLEVTTADINEFEPRRTFDRIVSVEMLEHVRNHAALLERVAAWLVPSGRLFVHVFSHVSFTYAFETDRAGDWMGRQFFTGGCMPGDCYLLRFQDHCRLLDHWRVSGRHYARTAEAWLRNLDRNRDAARLALGTGQAPEQAARLLQAWRVFFMACAELWAFRHGNEWLVSHYLFARR